MSRCFSCDVEVVSVQVETFHGFRGVERLNRQHMSNWYLFSNLKKKMIFVCPGHSKVEQRLIMSGPFRRPVFLQGWSLSPLLLLHLPLLLLRFFLLVAAGATSTATISTTTTTAATTANNEENIFRDSKPERRPREKSDLSAYLPVCELLFFSCFVKYGWRRFFNILFISPFKRKQKRVVHVSYKCVEQRLSLSVQKMEENAFLRLKFDFYGWRFGRPLWASGSYGRYANQSQSTVGGLSQTASHSRCCPADDFFVFVFQMFYWLPADRLTATDLLLRLFVQWLVH